MGLGWIELIIIYVLGHIFGVNNFSLSLVIELLAIAAAISCVSLLVWAITRLITKLIVKKRGKTATNDNK